jgi:opacity protein-like surface antigen
MIKNLIIPAVCVFCSAAYAENVYIGIEYSDTEFTFGGSSWAPKTIIANAGFMVNDWLSLEGRIGTSIDEEDETDDSTGLELSQLLGVYTKFSGRNNISNISPYVVAGYTDFEIEETSTGDTFKTNFSDFSIGAGMDFRIKENYIFNIEYIQYYDKGEANLSALSAELSYLF